MLAGRWQSAVGDVHGVLRGTAICDAVPYAGAEHGAPKHPSRLARRVRIGRAAAGSVGGGPVRPVAPCHQSGSGGATKPWLVPLSPGWVQVLVLISMLSNTIRSGSGGSKKSMWMPSSTASMVPAGQGPS